MLMRQSLDGDVSQAQQDSYHGVGHRPLEMQHIREESADSGLGMGSTFHLGSIPEDLSGMDSMDTGDLDTTLTDPATPTPTSTLVGCGVQQQAANAPSSAMIQNMGADLGTDFQTLMAAPQNSHVNSLNNESQLTWL
jgi:hypothetical protein